jgi:hypothetical protein
MYGTGTGFWQKAKASPYFGELYGPMAEEELVSREVTIIGTGLWTDTANFY